MRNRSRQKPFRQKDDPPATLPEKLSRPPRTDLSIRIDDLNDRTFAAVDAVADELQRRVQHSTSLDELRLLTTKAHLLGAMKSTHRSISLLALTDQDLAVDALPLTRMQLERCFLALLIEDQPGRWYKRYRKNAWKAFAEKFFREQACLGHLAPYNEYFDVNGPGVSTLRAFAREMDVWEDEFQTLRVMIRGEEMDPRWDKRYIADMPTPGKALHLLANPQFKTLGEILYPYYDNLSHFSHGGLAGVMESAILRSDPVAADDVPEVNRGAFFRSSVIEQTLPLSYASVLFAATLHCIGHNGGDHLRQALAAAWQPYHSDGSPMGIALWDRWAAAALGAEAKAKA